MEKMFGAEVDTKILGTGLSGMVGSRIVELLENKYEFENLSLETGVDITDPNQVADHFQKSDSSIVLHLAAMADVDLCEKEKEKAWTANVLGTKNIVDACLKSNKKIIYISTDFVFDGKSKIPYSEEDSPNPLNWYARTKYEGEKLVQGLSAPWIIARLSFPYRAKFERNDFFRAILEKLEKKEKVNTISNNLFNPTFIDDIAAAIDKLIEKEALGIYHVVGSQSLSSFDAAMIIAKIFNQDQSLVKKETNDEYFKNKAQRPLYSALKNDKIEKLAVKMKTFEEGLLEIKKQL